MNRKWFVSDSNVISKDLQVIKKRFKSHPDVISILISSFFIILHGKGSRSKKWFTKGADCFILHPRSYSAIVDIPHYLVYWKIMMKSYVLTCNKGNTIFKFNILYKYCTHTCIHMQHSPIGFVLYMYGYTRAMSQQNNESSYSIPIFIHFTGFV